VFDFIERVPIVVAAAVLLIGELATHKFVGHSVPEVHHSFEDLILREVSQLHQPPEGGVELGEVDVVEA